MERLYNPFIGGPIPNFGGWDECYRRIWYYDSCKPKPIKNKFNIGDEVWAITGHRVVDFKIGEIMAQAYKQAGNSIVVDVMMNIEKQIIKAMNW